MRAEKGEGVIPDIEFKPGFVRRMMGLVLGSTLLCNQPPRVVRLALAVLCAREFASCPCCLHRGLGLLLESELTLPSSLRACVPESLHLCGYTNCVAPSIGTDRQIHYPVLCTKG